MAQPPGAPQVLGAPGHRERRGVLGEGEGGLHCIIACTYTHARCKIMPASWYVVLLCYAWEHFIPPGALLKCFNRYVGPNPERPQENKARQTQACECL